MERVLGKSAWRALARVAIMVKLASFPPGVEGQASGPWNSLILADPAHFR
jgi:hypothetical protein